MLLLGGNVPSANHHIKRHTLNLCSTGQCYQNMESWSLCDLMGRFSNHEVQTRWWILEPVIFFPKYTQVKICHGKNIYTMFTTLLITPPPTHCVWVTKWAITYTMEQHPAIKSREVLAHATTEWTCRTQCLVKAASHKCQHTTWFHFLKVSRMDQSTAWKATSAVYSCVA